ncbi:MFS transporter [Rubrobacter xylanophilus]|uniref:MFS transporter n=1 Tax=Rubrobacter xylanophilus TaxID=49319 RepID=UPI001C640A62|nr:MFS transporter [Rubrobacter xylanophilus]
MPFPLSARFLTVLLLFSSMGAHVGVWAVLLADLSRSLGLSPASLGLALALQSLCGVAGLLAAGWVADHLGRRPVLVAGIAGTGSYLLLLPLVESYASLLAVLAFSGTVGFYDLACNLLGGDYERRSGRRVMNLFHAGFSGGAGLGALGSGMALAAGAGYEAVYSAAGAALLVLALAALRLPLPGGAPGPAVKTDEEPSSRLPAAVLACAALVFLCFFADAALEGYSSLYLRGVLGSGAALAGAGIAGMYFAGALGRLLGTAAVARLGERWVLSGAGLLAAAGLAAAALAGSASRAAAGLLLVGVALSPVAPLAFSLTARAAPGSGRAVSVVTAAGYLAFTAGPALFGAVADALSLGAAFLLLGVLCSTIALLARFSTERLWK